MTDTVRKFRNETGGDLSAFQVLKWGAPIITPTDSVHIWNNQQAFEGDTPTAQCDFAITKHPAASASEELIECVVSGVTPCKIEVSDENHTHAVAGTTVDKLVSSPHGQAKILWKESGTGEKDAVIMFGNISQPADYNTRIFKENEQTFIGTDTGWHQIDDFYFNAVTNPNGSDSWSGKAFGYNDIFDSRPDAGSDHNMRFQAAGTYYGIVSLYVNYELFSNDDFRVGETTGLKVTDSGSTRQFWEAGTSAKWLSQLDTIDVDLELLLTDVENTSHNTNFEMVGNHRIVLGGYVATSNLQPRGNIYIPFYFSIGQDDVPVEMQLWAYLGSGFGEASTKMIIKESDQTTSENISAVSWCRYVPDEVNVNAINSLFAVPPP